MSQRRLEIKVGVFVLIGLILLGMMVLQFSKGAYLFRPSYRVVMISKGAGGLKPRAAVTISGVQVGSVKSIRLAEDKRNVAVLLQLYSEYPVHRDARFVLETSGFLGDQYVSIVPTENAAPLLQDMDSVAAEPPFNLQEVARSATGIVKRVEETTSKLNDTVTDLRNTVLADATLTNLVATVSNLRLTSEQAKGTVDRLNSLVESNTPAVGLTLSNLLAFSEEMNDLAGQLHNLVSSNSPTVTRTLQNLDSSSSSLKSAMHDLEQGQGLAGTLLRNEDLAEDVTRIAENLRETTEHLNRVGLLGILRKRKEPATNLPPAQKLIAPKFSR